MDILRTYLVTFCAPIQFPKQIETSGCALRAVTNDKSWINHYFIINCCFWHWVCLKQPVPLGIFMDVHPFPSLNLTGIWCYFPHGSGKIGWFSYICPIKIVGIDHQYLAISDGFSNPSALEVFLTNAQGAACLGSGPDRQKLITKWIWPPIYICIHMYYV